MDASKVCRYGLLAHSRQAHGFAHCMGCTTAPAADMWEMVRFMMSQSTAAMATYLQTQGTLPKCTAQYMGSCSMDLQHAG